MLLFIGILVLEFGSLLMLHLEADVEGANITDASDALWYIIVTMSTVGYGDQYPITNPGRVVGVVIIVVGVGIFGTLTGYLANLFLGPKRRAADDDECPPSRRRGHRTEDAGPAPPTPTRSTCGCGGSSSAGALRDTGVLSTDEFERTKSEILSGRDAAG